MKLKRVNLLFITSTNYNKELFDQLIKKHLENKLFSTISKNILIINRNLLPNEIPLENISIYKEYQYLSGSIKNLLNEKNINLIKKLKKQINNDFEWTVVTDNETRNIELIIYKLLNLSKNFPLIVIDHGCINSQDLRLSQYLNFGRFIRNLFLFYSLCSEKYSLKKFFFIKIRRIYMHSVKPKIPLNKYIVIGYQELTREVKSLGGPSLNRHLNFESAKEKVGLLLTSGSHRYDSFSFRTSSVVEYINIIRFLNKNNSIKKIIIKTKPREDVGLLKEQISQKAEISKCIFLNSSKSINKVINEFDVSYIFTNLHSITLGAFSILRMNVYGYQTNYPNQFKKASWYFELYKPYKFINNIFFDNQKYVGIDSDKICRWFFNKDWSN